MIEVPTHADVLAAAARIAPHAIRTPLVESAVQMLASQAAERSISLYEDVPPDVPPVNVDAERILQVLANLVANAVKFTEPGGKVTVSAERTNNEVTISVTDTGAMLPHFVPFQAAKKPPGHTSEETSILPIAWPGTK